MNVMCQLGASRILLARRRYLLGNRVWYRMVSSSKISGFIGEQIVANIRSGECVLRHRQFMWSRPQWILRLAQIRRW